MRVLIADPQPSVRFALQALLQRQPGIEVAGEVSSASTLLHQVRTRCPDLVLLDGNLCDGVLADDLSTMRASCPDLTVVILSARPETERLALEAGANAFVCKTDPPEVLLAAVRAFQPTGWGERPHRAVV
jgi:DNA-binding NarL/FixJ family response regulator